METTERICGRLPRFYRAWDTQSNFFRLLESFAKIDDEQRKDLFSIMRSHWVDTGYNIDLDYLGAIFKLKRRPNEQDESFRKRIKLFIAEFTGGGTRESIIAQIVLYLDMKEEFPELIENPPVQQKMDKTVKHGDTWLMRSNSINLNEDAKISLVLDSGYGGQLIEVPNPVIRDLDTKASIKFKGTLRSGQELVVRYDDTAELDGADVTDKILIENRGLKVLRKGSTWMFEEDISPNIGRFDEGAFDKHVFDMFVPSTHLYVEWTARLLATFELRVSSRALQNVGMSKRDLEDLINAIKAIGVKAFITVEHAYNETGKEREKLEPPLDSHEQTVESEVKDNVLRLVALEQQ